MKLLHINNTHADLNNSYKNKYIFKLNNSQKLKGKIGVSNILLPYSTPNINNNIYFNSTFQIIYNGQINNFIINDGFYTLEQLNFYIQYLMRESNNNIPYNIVDGLAQYFIELKYDVITYSIKLNIFPTVLNGTAGKNGTIYNGLCPQININSNLSDILGLQKNKLYPSVNNFNSNFSISSNDEKLQPNLTPSNSYLITCNCVKNEIANPNNIIYSFSPNVSYGFNIDITPSNIIFLDIVEGYYDNITIEFYDQNYRPLYLKDNNLLVSLVIDD